MLTGEMLRFSVNLQPDFTFFSSGVTWYRSLYYLWVIAVVATVADQGSGGGLFDPWILDG
jgi:hypothetical protein